MSKTVIVLVAAILALALSEVAAPAEQDKESPQQPRVVPEATDPTAGGATASEREWEYLTALQKCELLVDDERNKCVDAARKKYGQM